MGLFRRQLAFSFTVAANASSSPRTGTLIITGQTYTVTQAGLGCSYTVTPTSAAFNYSGGTGTVAVTMTRATFVASLSSAAPPTGMLRMYCMTAARLRTVGM